MADQQVNRPHHKAKEKKSRPSGSQNPKAFGIAHPGRLLRQAGRSHDIKEKRLHVPLVDRLPDEAPPLVVAVVGPPQVGKTTLIKSLIKRYTKQTVTAPTGPLTVVTSKRRRLTFVECPADSLASMIDIAKVVDIVLLMIDGKYGFEMETMEFLNILASSGMPGNVFGILTHLDLFKKQDTLRAQKKRLKQRFWSELYQGAKLFYLSGVVNGRYPDREIHNLSRFLSVMKNPRPLVWRNSHPYCLADRYLDITSPTDIEANPKCDRTIALYGYLRGTNFPAQGAKVHVPGVGDLDVSEIEALQDPCPTPFQEQQLEKSTGKKARRRLGEKQKVLFAPMSDVGGVLVDKDAVYVDIKTSTFDRDGVNLEERGLGEQLVMGLQGDRRLLGQGDATVRLFGDATSFDVNQTSEDSHHSSRRPVDFANGTEAPDDDDYVSHGSDNLSEDPIEDDVVASIDSEEESEDASHEAENESLPPDSETSADNWEESEDSDGNVDIRWKTKLAERAHDLHSKKTIRRTADLTRLMYDLSLSASEAIKKWNGINEEGAEESAGKDERDMDDDFFTKKSGTKNTYEIDERMIPLYDYEKLTQKWTDPDNIRLISERFAMAKTNAGNSDDEGDAEENFSPVGSDDDEGDGEYEDLETGEAFANGTPANEQLTIEAERERNAKKKEELKLRFEQEDSAGFGKNQSSEKPDFETETFGEDEWYDAQKAKIQKQLDINRAEFDAMDVESRVLTEGFKAGTYARIVLKDVPYEFGANFNPHSPIIIGGLNPTEERFGYLQVRIKRHRWHQRILKTNDPLIISLGWRRFQSLPVYSIHENRMRYRMLKYTPEHMHCIGNFYGPLIAPNTGFCAVQSFSNKTSGFRIAATGVVLSVDESTEIVKKLKLRGYPHKIYRNTAIIKDLFASELEIAKFKSAQLRTVSGIRGMVKGNAGNKFPEGYVRAGFEDKILMSDIVFLSTWVVVKPKEFYTPVTNLLMQSAHAQNDANYDDNKPSDEDDAVWTGVRTVSAVRHALSIPTPMNKNSTYRPVERATRHFNPLRVPQKLAAELPFKSQIAKALPQKKATYLQKRAVIVGNLEERRARDLMQKLTTMRKEKAAKRAEAQEKRKEPYRKRVEEGLEKKREREKREKDEYWRREGKKRKNMDDANGAGGAKRRKSKA